MIKTTPFEMVFIIRVSMAHYHWSELLPQHIWRRGRDYYRDERIMDIRRSKNRIIAEVDGTELYIVSVSLDPATKRIEDHSCNCPYGEDGKPMQALHKPSVSCFTST